jgi:hypothetical protein
MYKFVPEISNSHHVCTCHFALELLGLTSQMQQKWPVWGLLLPMEVTAAAAALSIYISIFVCLLLLLLQNCESRNPP